MKRLMVVCLLAALGLQAVTPAFATRRVPVRHTVNRTTIIVRQGFPIRRPLPTVVVRPTRATVVVTPAVFLAPVFWVAALSTLPPRERMAWQESETLTTNDSWTDFTLNVNERGTRLYMDVKGWVQLNFAEIVYTNGEVQVVDFKETDRGNGTYSVLDLADGRKVSHVRVVARAKSEGSKIAFCMSK